MEIFGVAVGIALAVVAYAVSKHQRKWQRQWAAAAEQLGLEFHSGRFAIGMRIEGRLDGLSIKAAIDTTGSGPSWTVLEIKNALFPSNLILSSETFWTNAGKLFGEDDLQIGDPIFDAAVHVRGDEAEIRAVLGEAARAAFLKFVSLDKGQIADGCSRIRRPKLIDETREVVEFIHRGVRYAKLLSIPPTDVPRRLEEIVTSDPMPEARAHALAALLSEHPNSPHARTAARAEAQRRGSWQGTLLAGRFLGAEGFEVLRDIAENGEAPYLIRAEAVQHLKAHAPRALIVTVADRILAMPRTHRDGESKLILAVAFALATFAEPRAEAQLASLLDGEAEDVSVEAAEVLGRYGTIAAVMSLRSCADAAPLVGGGRIRDAAREAIARIQARLGGSDAGRLSIAEMKSSGGLSVTSERGAISVIDDPSGPKRTR